MTFNEDEIQHFQEIYTYSHHVLCKLLTPGKVMLVEDDQFDHDCLSHVLTPCGAPVINKAGQFIGMCFDHTGYLSSYNTRTIASKIGANHFTNFMSMAEALDFLRQ